MSDVSGIIVRNMTMMRRYASKLSGNETNADDIFQQACVFALQSKSPPAPDYERKWLATCVWNAMSQFVASGRRLVSDGGEAADRESCSGGQFDHVRLSDVKRIMSRMPRQQRDCFEAVAIEGMELREAAQALGFKTHGSVNRYHKRAMAMIADA